MINNYKKLKDSFNVENLGPIFFVTPNPIRGIGLEKEIKNYHIICSQESDVIDYLKKEKISVLCLNDGNVKNSGKILEDKKVLNYIKIKSKGRKANVVTFKPSPKIAKICSNNGFIYLGNDWRLNRKLENKIEFVDIVKMLDIPSANSRVVELEKANKLEKLFDFSQGQKYVIQLPRGFSGNSTFLIRGRNELNNIAKKYKGRRVKVSKYIEGETYTVNACVGKFGTVVSQPIFQITGLASCSRSELGTCGNDYVYGENLRSGEKRKIFDYTEKMGKYLKKLGYRGIFGLDFVVSGKDAGCLAKRPVSSGVHLIEINPRLVFSIPVFTKLQIQNNQTPFLLLHVLEFLSCEKMGNYDYDKKLAAEAYFKKYEKEKCFNAAQLILRNIKKNPCKIIKSLPSGVYEIKKDNLILKEEAYYMERGLKDGEFLIQCAAKNSLVSSDMEYANIQAGYGIMKNKKQFNSYFNNIIRIVLKNIKIKIKIY
jgi:hypothetical protein